MQARLTALALCLCAGIQTSAFTLTIQVPEQSGQNSYTRWEYILDLSQHSVSGDTVSWSVNSVTIRELNNTGAEVARWTDDSPLVDAPAGLWAVTHADPQAPEPLEFWDMPPISGVGSPAGSGFMLVYIIEGIGLGPEGAELLIWLEREDTSSIIADELVLAEFL